MDASGFSNPVLSTGVGNTGNINIKTNSLSLTNGASMSVASLGKGNAGTINIQANTISVDGQDSNANPSLASAGLGFGAVGKAGNLNINANAIKVTNGALLSTSTRGQGSGGNININAVSSQGSGNAGNLTIGANSILLNGGASIGAESRNGSEGNIFINADNIQLLNNSNITTNATGAATGGNITIDAGAIAQLNNSNITASASQARGGNISIQTQGLFQSIDSNIQATGSVNGEIKITTPDIKQDNSLKEQSSEIISTENVISTSCLARQNSTQGTFVVTDNGGLPKASSNDLDMLYSIAQVRGVNIAVAKKSHIITQSAWKIGDQVQEATQLVITHNGRLLLAATNKKLDSAQSLVCNVN